MCIFLIQYTSWRLSTEAGTEPIGSEQEGAAPLQPSLWRPQLAEPGRSHCKSDLGSVQVTQSCLTLCDPHGLYSPWNSPGQNTGVGSPSLLQGIFPIQVSRIAGGFLTS